ncbi:MFS transporter [Virgibacillus doumboii]|uniref:MFS transporter n=1 Tax=Virgibacillus doumboii TaxID=2697503 RepID=UPI0013DF47DF|nr:MFS transporter [Virgibacillus doumboii]
MDAAIQNQAGKEKVPVFKNRNFIFLFIAAMFSSPGYYVYLIGAEWLMLSLSDNRFFFGMLFFAASIPRLLLLVVGGLVADRINKRTILFISDMTRAILILALIALVWTDSVTAYHLIALAALFGISDAFSYPALNSMTPAILEDDQLQRGNSFIQMTMQISPILGPALGGTMIAVLGFEGVFTIACGMLLLSALAVIFIKLPKNDSEMEKATPMQDLVEGFQYARKNNLVISIVVVALFINFFFSGPFSIGMPIIVKDVFEGSAVSLAMVQTSMGIGALIGAIYLAAKKLKKPGLALVVSLIILGVLYTITGISTYLYITVGTVMAMAFLTQLINIPLFTMLQQTTDKKMIGRMMSFLVTASTGLIPVSYVVTSILIAANVGIQTIITISGIVIALIGVYSLKNKTILRYQAKE